MRRGPMLSVLFLAIAGCGGDSTGVATSSSASSTVSVETTRSATAPETTEVERRDGTTITRSAAQAAAYCIDLWAALQVFGHRLGLFDIQPLQQAGVVCDAAYGEVELELIGVPDGTSPIQTLFAVLTEINVDLIDQLNFVAADDGTHCRTVTNPDGSQSPPFCIIPDRDAFLVFDSSDEYISTIPESFRGTCAVFEGRGGCGVSDIGFDDIEGLTVVE